MIIDPNPQGSEGWLNARAGIPTASELDNIVSPKWEIRKGEMPKTYLGLKAAEWWLGHPIISSFGSFGPEQGNILEEEARPWFEIELEKKIEKVGFCVRDDKSFGCSPDGIIGYHTGIEIKCLQPPAHTKLLLAGIVPPDYIAQVHGSMYATGYSKWIFAAYCRNFPSFVLQIDRDDDIQKTIALAVGEFSERLWEAQAKLTELNGGPRKAK